ncbi:toprim domain-containing protein [Paenibacillus thalictri]|uniref:DNA primase n=1 Tax=Paenibacillus thalictri TaxID=2527873 RepID=A0A4Q9DGZ2_9BACL|nr:toprim domain-containing protein [Paenibacillus thalictri]TBL71554.1 DNA primase [Paenibacillus thalictri]
MSIAIIVEGKNDKSRLRRLLTSDVLILCTFGSLNTDKLEALKKKAGDRQIYLFTDNDASGKKIRGILRDTFPDAEQIYTRRGYAGVEGTPDEYIVLQLEKAGLDEFIVYPEEDPAIASHPHIPTPRT